MISTCQLTNEPVIYEILNWIRVLMQGQAQYPDFGVRMYFEWQIMLVRLIMGCQLLHFSKNMEWQTCIT